MQTKAIDYPLHLFIFRNVDATTLGFVAISLKQLPESRRIESVDKECEVIKAGANGSLLKINRAYPRG